MDFSVSPFQRLRMKSEVIQLAALDSQTPFRNQRDGRNRITFESKIQLDETGEA